VNKIIIPKTHNTHSLQWVDQDHGIRSSSFFSNFKKKSIFSNITNVLQTIFMEFGYTFKSFYKNVLVNVNNMELLQLNPSIGKEGLVVFFHGLNGKPSVWNNHIAHFNKLSNDCGIQGLDLFAPAMPNKGHCALNDGRIGDLVTKIVEWSKLNPSKPIVLIGQSNGSRIALEIETRLRTLAPCTPISISLTGAVLYGTSLIDRLVSFIGTKVIVSLSRGLLTSTCIEELKEGSESSKKLLTKAREELPNGCAERRYRMYAPDLDSHIWEKGSSLPVLNPSNSLNKNEKHYLKVGYGHNSIVDAFVMEQVEKSLHWMKRKIDPSFAKIKCKHCVNNNINNNV
jgi:hypothetical protein